MKDLRDWVDVAFKIVLAGVGVVVGYFFSFQKQQNDDIKLIVELATDKETAKRVMAASIAEAYFRQNRIPEALYVAVFRYANSISDDKDLQRAVNSAVGAATKDDKSLQNAVTKASSSLPVRIYFHIRQDADRVSAKALGEKIASANIPSGNSIIIPGVELVTGQQSKSTLRCFKKIECQTLGPQLVQAFKDNGSPVELEDLSSRYEASTSIRPNHFEAWFAPGLK